MRFFSSSGSDIPFARDDAQRLLPMMIACLVGFVALLLAAVLSLNSGLERQSAAVQGALQIELPSDVTPNAVERVVQILGKTQGVDDVTVMRDAQMEALLAPWLGKGFALDALPVPVLIDVQTETQQGKTRVNLAALSAELKKIHRAAMLHDQGPWVSQLSSALLLFQGLMVLVAGLLVLCCAGLVVLVARTNLRLHFKAVGLLHMFGATDEYILRQFQRNSALLAGRGAMIGSGVAGSVLVLLAVISEQSDTPLLPALHLTFGHGLLCVGLPLLMGAIAWIATRFTVRGMLHHMH